MSKQQVCPFCGEDLEDPPAIHGEHVCQVTELLNARREVKRLRESIMDWRGGWFQLREIIGDLWWHHKAIDNREQRTYYQNNLLILAKKKQEPWAAPNTTYATDGTIQRDGQAIGRWKR